MKAARIVKVPPHVGRDLRLTAHLAGSCVEEVMRVALVYFAMLPPDEQVRAVHLFWANKDKTLKAGGVHGRTLRARLGRALCSWFRGSAGSGGDEKNAAA